MKKIIISPYSRKLLNGKNNPKNYPYWNSVCLLLKFKGYEIVQIGVEGEEIVDGVNEVMFNLSFLQLEKLVLKCKGWISVDNFFQHFCYLLNKPGVVIFGPSDPLIFGHFLNINLLKDRMFLREDQFNLWDSCEFKEERFIEPLSVVNAVVYQLRDN